jgi:hypothetical protein
MGRNKPVAVVSSLAVECRWIKAVPNGMLPPAAMPAAVRIDSKLPGQHREGFG